MRDPRIAAGAALLLMALASTPSAGQTVRLSEAVGDGTLRSELSLVGRTASIAVTPGLKADGPEHRRVAGGSGEAARVRIGSLQTNGELQFGAVMVGKVDPAGVRFDLTLAQTPDGWRLLAEPAAPTAQTTGAAEGAASAAPSAPAIIALTRQAKPAAAAAALVAAWIPIGRDTAQLTLSWGELAMSADVQFIEAAVPRRDASRQNAPINRRHDEPNRGARQLMLSQLNETALVLPAGARLSVMFGRSFPRGQRAVSAAGTLRRAGLGVDGPDYGRLMHTGNGGIVQLTEAAVPRLLIGAPIRFGKITLRPGNHAPGYPGAYGMWLKKVGPGWRLVFNSESDIWGTQHDPKSDVGELELQHAEGGDPSRPFSAALVPSSTDRGRLLIIWGSHQWNADYVIAP